MGKYLRARETGLNKNSSDFSLNRNKLTNQEKMIDSGMNHLVIVLVILPWAGGEPCNQTLVHPTSPQYRYHSTDCGLDLFPGADIPSGIQLIDLTNNLLQNLTLDKDYPQLEIMVITDNPLLEFPNVTRAKYKLKKLYLARNKINFVNVEILDELTQLDTLGLGENELTSFPDVSSPGHALVHLSLKTNLFTSYPNLPNLGQNLISLNMGENAIEIINMDDWPMMPMLGTLQVHRNKLTVLNLPLKSNFPMLSVIKAEENQISVVNTPPDSVLDGVTSVDLSRNKLTSFPDLRDAASSMTYLSLSFNDIRTIPASFLSPLRISTLSITNNKLDTFPDMEGVGEYLQVIWLHGNQISTIPDSGIAHLTKLKSLGLSSNRLETLPDLGPVYPNLEYLFMGINPYLDPQGEVNTVMAGLRAGYRLGTHGLDLTYLPPDICGANPPSAIVLGASPPLVCDCRLRWVLVASRAGLDIGIDNSTHACVGGPEEMLNVPWGDIKVSDLQCNAGNSRKYKLGRINFSCVSLPVEETLLAETGTSLSCAHACLRSDSCFMFRYRENGVCSLIKEGGSATLTDTSDLYKIH